MLTKKESVKSETKITKDKKNSAEKTAVIEKNSPSSTRLSPSVLKNSETASTKHPQEIPADKKNSIRTRITIKYDAGFPNQIFIRGKGGNLNWEKGQPLKNVKANEWIWETDSHFSTCEFKVLINDQTYECGENHVTNCGSMLLYTPHF